MALVLLPVALLVTSGAGAAPLVVFALLMFGVGFADDLRPLGPGTKLLGQAVAAGAFLCMAPHVSVAGVWWLDVAAAWLWLVGIPNAFNLQDNMDGLAGGLAVIAAVAFIAIVHAGGLTRFGLDGALASLAGAAAGFLLFNRPPASVFMGDAGSHLIGSVLAGAIWLTLPAAAGGPATFFALAAVVLVPVADTGLVVVTRLSSRRSPFVGGRDHASHRLVCLGLADARAVLLLDLVAAAGGVAGWLLAAGLVRAGAIALATVVVACVLGAMRLGRIRIEPSPDGRGIHDTSPPGRPRDATAGASRVPGARANPVP